MNKKFMHHVCIQTNDYKSSLNFYTKILGFEIYKETKNFHNRDYNTWLKLGNFMIELQTPKNNVPFSKYNTITEWIVHMCFYTDSVEDEYNRIKSLGYTNFKVKNGSEIYRVEDGLLFKVKAPEGTEIEFRDSLI